MEIKTPFDITKRRKKARIEHKAMKHALGNLTDRESMLNSLLDFDAEEKESSKFAHYCDKLEADIQSKIYQDSGRHKSLDEQQNNVVFKKSKSSKRCYKKEQKLHLISGIYMTKIFTKTVKKILKVCLNM
ncbi:MAG: HD domain-containing protein [Clostridium sp.]|nr:MAG: HD domain-containing protein [Clostridium sp.]